MSINRGKSTRVSSALQFCLSLNKPEYGVLSDMMDSAIKELSGYLGALRESRDQLADQLAYLLKRKVSTAQLNAWLSPSNANRMPLDVFFALCRIAGNAEPIAIMLELFDVRIATPADEALAELGRCQIEREEITQREQDARAALNRGRR